jgi:1,4-dihydroxy-2-naphthoate octaprenyltransferase
VASIPIALLVAMILYVNEVPDRPADERAGKRTLPVRLPQPAVINLYLVAALAAFTVIVGGVLTGVLPIPALLAVLALPLVRRVYDGLQANYDSPYGLMSVMAVNIKVHLYVGGLLIVGYLIALAVRFVATR